MAKTVYDADARLKFVQGLPVEYFKYYGEGQPTLYALIWCMYATSMCRIFTKEDLYEFLYRLPVALNSIEPVERWLMKEKLLNYEFRGKQYVLTLEDVTIYFGIEVTDHYINFRPREKFLENVAKSINTAMLIGTIGDFSVLAPEEDEEGWKRLTGQEHSPKITPELLAKAEFFAKDTLKFVPENVFIDRHPLITIKEEELDKRREKIKNLPKFDLGKIPRKIIKDWIRETFKPGYAKKYLEDGEAFDNKIKPLVYLAWLMANDLIYINGPLSSENEGVAFNWDDYELPGGGSNLEITVEEYRLDELAIRLNGR